MKLIAIDLDGTLLSSKLVISEENIAAIHEVQEKNSIVVISSGRSFHDTRQILQKTNINCPFITGNGSISYNQRNIIRKLTIPTPSLESIISLLNDMSIYYELYSKDGVCFLPHGKSILLNEIDSLKNRYSNFSVADAYHTIDIQFAQHGWRYLKETECKNLESLDIYKIYIHSFEQEKLQKVKDMFSNRDDISTTMSGTNNFEIAHKESSKGNALVHFAEHLNIPIENTVAIGDSYNDLSMFHVAGISISMANAEDAVKKHTTYTTLSNNENGVAHAIHKYVLCNQLCSC